MGKKQQWSIDPFFPIMMGKSFRKFNSGRGWGGQEVFFRVGHYSAQSVGRKGGWARFFDGCLGGRIFSSASAGAGGPLPTNCGRREAGVRNTKKGPRALEDKEEEREQSSLSSRIDRLDWTGRAGGRERGETLPPPLLT